MKNQRNRGFTVVELMIVVSLLAVLFLMAFAPLTGSLAQTQREASMLTMDLSAKRSFSRISSALGHALLPIATYPDHDVPVARNNVATFQDLVNSLSGFGAHGVEWRDVLMRGTDFVPFAVPVDFGGDGDTLDSRLALELGIAFPDGRELAAGVYLERDGQNVLDGSPGCLHPSLAHLVPADFGSDIAPGDRSMLDLSQPRFVAQPGFAADREGFGVLRFVPASGADGKGWLTLDERELTEKGVGGQWDLNDDGRVADSYVMGGLEFVYVGDGGNTLRVPITAPNILLQLNRDSPAWKPLFKLVRQGAQDDETTGDEAGDAATPEAGGYALLVNLLVFDQVSQKGSPLAFNAAVPYLVRRHQTMIELRNMSNANQLKDESQAPVVPY